MPGSIACTCRSEPRLQAEAQTVTAWPRLSSQEPRLPRAVFQMPQTLQPHHPCASPCHCSSTGPRHKRGPAPIGCQPALAPPCSAAFGLPGFAPPPPGREAGADSRKRCSGANSANPDHHPEFTDGLPGAAKADLLAAEEQRGRSQSQGTGPSPHPSGPSTWNRCCPRAGPSRQHGPFPHQQSQSEGNGHSTEGGAKASRHREVSCPTGRVPGPEENRLQRQSCKDRARRPQEDPAAQRQKRGPLF